MTIELYTGNAGAVEERLERGLLDFGLLLEPVNLENNEWERMPGEDWMGVCVAADGLWGKLGAVTPADLVRIPLLLIPLTSNKALGLVAWSGGTVDPEALNVVGRFDLIGNASHLLRAGVACELGIDHLLQFDGSSDLRFIPFDPPCSISSYLVWKKCRLRSRACDEFLRRVRGVLD